MAMKLVKYKCGCVGFYPPLPATKKSLILDYCATTQDDPGGLGACHVEIKDPDTHDVLQEDDIEILFKKIGSLVGDGYRWRELKRLID